MKTLRGPLCATLFAAAAVPVHATPVQWTGPGGNGHYYEFVLAESTFGAAQAAAAASTFLGERGYLATVTSAAEQAFLFDVPRFASLWIGGSDIGTPGTWSWVDGPEAGTVFWKDGAATAFSAFGPSNPQPGFAGNGGLWGNNGNVWNNLDRDAYKLGYVVEYGGLPPVPEPASWVLMLVGAGVLGATADRRRRPGRALAPSGSAS